MLVHSEAYLTFSLSVEHGNKGLAMQLLQKTGSVAVHGNPFSDDDGRHDKSPLLIGSVDSSYAFETPRR